MTKWHAHVAHMAKHMNMVGGPLWWGARAPFPPLNPALDSHAFLNNLSLLFGYNPFKLLQIRLISFTFVLVTEITLIILLFSSASSMLYAFSLLGGWKILLRTARNVWCSTGIYACFIQSVLDSNDSANSSAE